MWVMQRELARCRAVYGSREGHDSRERGAGRQVDSRQRLPRGRAHRAGGPVVHQALGRRVLLQVRFLHLVCLCACLCACMFVCLASAVCRDTLLACMHWVGASYFKLVPCILYMAFWLPAVCRAPPELVGLHCALSWLPASSANLAADASSVIGVEAWLHKLTCQRKPCALSPNRVPSTLSLFRCSATRLYLSYRLPAHKLY